MSDIDAHIRGIREADVDAVKPLFPKNARVLELGGGNGYQASLIASWGCEVCSIDIQTPPPGEPRFFDVQVYDGVRIPFEDGTFDIVYSSAVLEHVPDPVSLLRETRRVMRPSATGIYILPSATWRFWTLAAHYPYLLKRLGSVLAGGTGPSAGSSRGMASAGPPPRRSMTERIRRVMISEVHGEYPSALAEVYYFSGRRWANVFAQAGLRIAKASGNGVFYTGYRLFPWLGNSARRRLASVLGSPCHVFTVRRRD